MTELVCRACGGPAYQCSACHMEYCLDPQCVHSEEPSVALDDEVRLCWTCRPPKDHGGIEVFF